VGCLALSWLILPILPQKNIFQVMDGPRLLRQDID